MVRVAENNSSWWLTRLDRRFQKSPKPGVVFPG
jgi:hypothetical protein